MIWPRVPLLSLPGAGAISRQAISFLTFVYDREKIQFLSFMMHLTERSGGDFGIVYRYYLSLEQELAFGKPLVV